MRFIKLRHEVVGAQYDEGTGKWHVRVRRTDADTGAMTELEDVVDILIPAVGVLSRWKWPDIEGLHDFKGEVHHTAGFDPKEKTWQEIAEDWKHKKVAVIGVVSHRLAPVPWRETHRLEFLRMLVLKMHPFSGLERDSTRSCHTAEGGEALQLREGKDVARRSFRQQYLRRAPGPRARRR